jgi:hypothetical protein
VKSFQAEPKAKASSDDIIAPLIGTGYAELSTLDRNRSASITEDVRIVQPWFTDDNLSAFNSSFQNKVSVEYYYFPETTPASGCYTRREGYAVPVY